jgi:TM2 domain-containing membrane protein YozV
MKSKKSNIVAGVLALLLGAFGIHHFYLGNKIRGVVYLLFFWTFIPGLIAFFEGIALLVADEERFNYKYNRQDKVAA